MCVCLSHYRRQSSVIIIHFNMDNNNSVSNKVDVHHNQTYPSSYSSSSRAHSQRDVRYSCGSCGYDLNLSSSNRNIPSIGSKYEKSIKRGIISFSNIDDSRFGHVDQIECTPHFSKKSWGFFRRKTKLLCRKCCNHIGNASNANQTPTHTTKYDIRIRALQPSSSQQHGISVLP